MCTFEISGRVISVEPGLVTLYRSNHAARYDSRRASTDFAAALRDGVSASDFDPNGNSMSVTPHDGGARVVITDQYIDVSLHIDVDADEMSEFIEALSCVHH